MPRDRKQYNRDMTQQKVAYRTTTKQFKQQQSALFKKTSQQEPVSTPPLTLPENQK